MGTLHQPLFGAAAVDVHLSDRARLQALLDVEAALAAVQGALGIIPAAAAAPIAAPLTE